MPPGGPSARTPTTTTLVAAALQLLVATGCVTAECPPGEDDSIFCRSAIPDTDAGPDAAVAGDGATSVDGGDGAVCIDGADCTDPLDPCMAGVLDCSGDTPTCRVTGPAPSTTPCGDGWVCDGAGNCSICVDGAICNTGNPCTSGAVDCGSGMPVCLSSDDVMPVICVATIPLPEAASKRCWPHPASTTRLSSSCGAEVC